MKSLPRRVVLAAIIGASLLRVAPAAAQSPPTAPPGPLERRQAWEWGALVEGRSYRGLIRLTNECTTSQQVEISTRGLADLAIPSAWVLPPRQTTGIPYVITPSAPGPDQNRSIAGEVEVWRPGEGGTDCRAIRLIHVVSGRRASPASAAQSKPDPEQAALQAVCATWWLFGENPVSALIGQQRESGVRKGLAKVNDRTCAAVVRPAALGLREQILKTQATIEPDAWKWLPEPKDVNRMSMAELAAFRQRVLASPGGR